MRTFRTDPSLLAKVEQHRNGSNVHAINKALIYYKRAEKEQEDKSIAQRAYWGVIGDRIERALRRSIHTGDWKITSHATFELF